MASEHSIPQLDAVLGKAAVAAGGTGITIQLLTDWGGVMVLGLNALLALGGLYLLALRIRKARRELNGPAGKAKR